MGRLKPGNLRPRPRLRCVMSHRDSSSRPAGAGPDGSRALVRPWYRRRAWLIALGIALLVAAGLAAGREAADALPTVTAWVQSSGVWAPLLFVAAYAAACAAFVPASVLTLAAGAIFGLWTGIGLVIVGASLGAAGSFLIARYVARERVERWLAGNARLSALDVAVGDEGRRIMFLLRLSPAFPFSAMNYALGLTRVRFMDFLIAMAGILPGTTLYVYAGTVAGVVASAASTQAPSRGTGYYVVLALGLAATLAVTLAVTRLARRALAHGGSAAHPRDNV